MSIQQIMQQLQSQHAHHLDQAARLRRAIEALNGLLDAQTSTNRTTVAKARNGNTKVAARAKRRSSKLTLSKALAYVLGEYQKTAAAGATARELMEGLAQAGYRFGSRNAQNNLNYLYKTLRRDKQFKRGEDGLFALA